MKRLRLSSHAAFFHDESTISIDIRAGCYSAQLLNKLLSEKCMHICKSELVMVEDFTLPLPFAVLHFNSLYKKTT